MNGPGEEPRVRVRLEDVLVTEMRHADVDQVAAIERSSYATPWTPRAFNAELRDNAYAHYIVARLDGRVVGYAGMWVLLDEAHVTNIAVREDFRRRGIGDLLLSELERRAAARGAARMTLEVRPSNVVAQHLYRKHGFYACGRRRGYYQDTGEDAIIMWKDGLQPEGSGGRGVGR